MAIQIKYGIGRKVDIIKNGQPGEIIGIYIDKDRIQYYIQYADLNKIMHEIYLDEKEFTPQGVK